jgi:hypothetical protein
MSIVVRCANFIVKLSKQMAVKPQRPTGATDRMTNAMPVAPAANPPEIIEWVSRAFDDT